MFGRKRRTENHDRAVVKHLSMNFRETITDKDGKSVTTEYSLRSRRYGISEKTIVALALLILLAVAGSTTGTWSEIIEAATLGLWKLLR